MCTQRLYERWQVAYQNKDHQERLKIEEEILNAFNSKIVGASQSAASSSRLKTIDARDIAQWARLSLLQSLYRYEPDKALLLVYANAVIDGAINAFIADEYHKYGCRLLNVRTWDELQALKEATIRPEDDSIQDVITDQIVIREKMKRLPVRQAEILQKRYWEEMTQEEVAAELGISQQMVSRLEAEALQTLRSKLSEAFS